MQRCVQQLGLALVALCTLQACRAPRSIDGEAQQTADGRIHVRYWRHHHSREVETIRELIARFERANPSIAIELRTFPYDVYKTKVVATLAAADGPHIVNIHNSWAHGYIKSRLIQPVPAGLFAPGELEREFFPLLDAFRNHGACYAIPIGAGNLALFYNKTLFRRAGLDPSQPPRTWSELLASARRLTRHGEGGRLLQAGASIGTGAGQGWNYFVEGVLRQARVPIIAPDLAAVGWNTERGARALRWFTDFIKHHRVNSALFPAHEDAFRLGLSAMMIEGPWEVGRLDQIAPDLDYGVAALPMSDDGVQATYGSVWGNAVTREATGGTRDAAWRFLQFLARYESMRRWSERTGELPLRKRVKQDQPFIRRLGRLTPFLQQMDHAFASVKKDEEHYRRAMIDAIDEVVLEDTDPRVALDGAARRINAMLARD